MVERGFKQRFGDKAGDSRRLGFVLHIAPVVGGHQKDGYVCPDPAAHLAGGLNAVHSRHPAV